MVHWRILGAGSPIDTGDHGGCWYGHSKETPIRLIYISYLLTYPQHQYTNIALIIFHTCTKGKIDTEAFDCFSTIGFTAWCQSSGNLEIVKPPSLMYSPRVHSPLMVRFRANPATVLPRKGVSLPVLMALVAAVAYNMAVLYSSTSKGKVCRDRVVTPTGRYEHVQEALVKTYTCNWWDYRSKVTSIKLVTGALGQNCKAHMQTSSHIVMKSFVILKESSRQRPRSAMSWKTLEKSGLEPAAPNRLADRKHCALSTQPNPHLLK